jgi:hypothetical protein
VELLEGSLVGLREADGELLVYITERALETDECEF